jgi:hypothetical protein
MTKVQTFDKLGELIVLDEKKSSYSWRLTARGDAWRVEKNHAPIGPCP